MPSVLRDGDGVAKQQPCGPRRCSEALPCATFAPPGSALVAELPHPRPMCCLHAPYGTGKASVAQPCWQKPRRWSRSMCQQRSLPLLQVLAGAQCLRSPGMQHQGTAALVSLCCLCPGTEALCQNAALPWHRPGVPSTAHRVADWQQSVQCW